MTDRLDDYGRAMVKEHIYLDSNLDASWIKKDIDLFPEVVDFDAFTKLKHIHDNCGRFVKEGWNLNLYSKNVGNGKTSWAIKILKNFVETYGCNFCSMCLYINVPQFIAMSKDFENPDSMNKYAELKSNAMNRDYKLVIFDEIASKQATEADMQNLFTIIDHRIITGKSCIYTSNVLPEELKKLVGERIADRIAGADRTVNIELKGGSRRKATEFI